MAQKYEIIVTNPPYMGSSGMSDKLSAFVKDTYPNTKADMFSCCMDKAHSWVTLNGYISMITMESWMFLTSFQKFREKLIRESSIANMVHMPYLGKGGTSLGISFGTSAFVFRRRKQPNYIGNYSCVRYYETDDEGIPYQFPTINERYAFTTSDSFMNIPGCIVAYWIDEGMKKSFSADSVGSVLTTREGMATAGNDTFLRLWYELPESHISFGADCADDVVAPAVWVPYNKGGEFRKWYGNNDYVVFWENDGAAIKNNKDPKTGRIRSHNYNGDYGFRAGITWSALSSAKISVRYCPKGYLFDSKGAKGFTSNEDTLLYCQALINSSVGLSYLDFLSPTIDFKVGDIIQIPLIVNHKEEVVSLVRECIALVKADWDSNETSWDYSQNPLVRIASSFSDKKSVAIADCFSIWEKECLDRYESLIGNEERINQILAEVYGMNSAPVKIDAIDVSVKKADLTRDIKYLISYAVGCMFGRYSLSSEGLAYTGGEWDNQKYTEFHADKDNIIPICDDEYFEDDIVGRFVEFISIVFGKTKLEENLQFIASAIGGKGSSKEIIRNYFISDFYKDHCSLYSIVGGGKRPIYWLFDSGKKNGFKALIYMHRYQADTIARIRTDYVHEQQSRYRTAIADLQNRIANASTSERVKLNKKLKNLQEQAEEIRVYEEKIHHLADQMISIDLDDGVKVNYAKFQDVLAKIK